MSKLHRLSHTLWNCSYHIITLPKYRFSVLTKQVETDLRNQVYKLSRDKRVVVEGLNIQPDHLHLVVSIPPNISLSDYMGYLKGKSAIDIFKKHPQLAKRYWGKHFWARGYCVMTTGFSKDEILKYVAYGQKILAKG
jgi:putative transposase